MSDSQCEPVPQHDPECAWAVYAAAGVIPIPVGDCWVCPMLRRARADEQVKIRQQWGGVEEFHEQMLSMIDTLAYQAEELATLRAEMEKQRAVAEKALATSTSADDAIDVGRWQGFVAFLALIDEATP